MLTNCFGDKIFIHPNLKSLGGFSFFFFFFWAFVLRSGPCSNVVVVGELNCFREVKFPLNSWTDIITLWISLKICDVLTFKTTYIKSAGFLKNKLSLILFLCLLRCSFTSDTQRIFVVLQFVHLMIQKWLNLVKEWGKYWKVLDGRYVFNDGTIVLPCNKFFWSKSLQVWTQMKLINNFVLVTQPIKIRKVITYGWENQKWSPKRPIIHENKKI